MAGVLLSKKQFSKLSAKQKNQAMNPRRRRPRRPRGPAVVVKGTAPRKGRGRRRNGRGRGVRGPRGIEGMGIMTGGEIVNTRTHSAPEIREGEELIATVSGSVGFTTTQFNINPANATTFPWLSKIAQLFERYEFEQLSFHFGHDVSGFAAQGQTGLIYLSALYDAASAAPTSVTQIEATDPFVPCMPNQDSCCRLDKKSMHPSNEPKYCLQGNPPGATDIKTYNVGSVFVSTTGMANTTEIGKFRVKYKIRLFDRILDSSQAAAPANFVASWFQNASAQVVTTAVPTTMLLATVISNGLGIVNTAGSMVPPAGNYLIDCTSRCNDSASEQFTGVVDIQKNGATIYTASASDIPTFNMITGLAADKATLPNSVFVTANGTDAFTVVATLTGAAGALTSASCCRWCAV